MSIYDKLEQYGNVVPREEVDREEVDWNKYVDPSINVNSGTGNGHRFVVSIVPSPPSSVPPPSDPKPAWSGIKSWFGLA